MIKCAHEECPAYLDVENGNSITGWWAYPPDAKPVPGHHMSLSYLGDYAEMGLRIPDPRTGNGNGHHRVPLRHGSDHMSVLRELDEHPAVIALSPGGIIGVTRIDSEFYIESDGMCRDSVRPPGIRGPHDL